jgi:hypothetical protein
MPVDPPIACSLTAAQMPARLQEMAAIGAEALISMQAEDARALLRFRAGAQIAERLAALVEAESRCCAFLDMQLREEPEGLALTITAPAGAEPVLKDLVAAFGATPAA